jgi:hypothetical protein
MFSRHRLAKEIGVPSPCIGDVVCGERSVNAAVDLRLGRFFGLSDGRWLRTGGAQRPQGVLGTHTRRAHVSRPAPRDRSF